jgi:ADP-ribosylglycohydrolase
MAFANVQTDMKSIDLESRYIGCLLGLALGDALGAPLEGGVMERAVWRSIGRTKDGRLRFTDDTQMSLDLAQSLIAKGSLDPDDIASRFAKSYRWSRGYGRGAARMLKKIKRGMDWREANRSVFPNGSFGNGAAMRSPVIGLFFAETPSKIPSHARSQALITHAHPLGQESSVLIARAAAFALLERSPCEILAELKVGCVEDEFLRRLNIAGELLCATDVGPEVVRENLGNGIKATESVVTALYVACRFFSSSFETMLHFVSEIGGDVDTIGAMAGAIFGARNGMDALQKDAIDRLEQADHIAKTARELFRTRAES